MLTDARFLLGVALGAGLYWFLYGMPAGNTQVGVGGMVPKPIRREGRLLQGLGKPQAAFWPFSITRG